ncbi:MAG: FGGY-family carbohydrate kinase [Sphaerospermopsis sp. SIO1G2]|nr:FGGY-family carbohydrate kinase [Sphaerospermopsis sp. SIO1G1]NET71179.1 FGGY-family carbohydrate kinase [Sphaerospermopsis sp. SIO1G2]
MNYLGIDFGTSGARAIVINDQAEIVFQIRYPWENTKNWIDCWQKGLWSLLGGISQELRGKIGAIVINGTSSTILLTDANGQPIDDPLLYNDSRGSSVIQDLSKIAPPQHTVLSATSSLAKLLWMQKLPTFSQARYLLHQADWLSFLLHGQLGISDYHNALKLGYDVENLEYPKWLEKLQIPVNLPQVLIPGTPIQEIKPEIAVKYGLRRDCWVCAGTTDSIAAFLASGAKLPGEAVTSLGSTLVLKLLSHTRIENSQYGIYSHRLGDLWLTGGASNTGGAVLNNLFSHQELVELSQKIDLSKDNQLDYYPLLKPGERFPINDPLLSPKLEPRPDDNKEFLYGLLASMSRIEARGYELLQELGADKLTHVYTAGGGAGNYTWTAIRRKCLRVPVISSNQTEAAYGSALLGMRNVKR